MGKPVSPAAQSPGPGGWSPLYLRAGDAGSGDFGGNAASPGCMGLGKRCPPRHFSHQCCPVLWIPCGYNVLMRFGWPVENAFSVREFLPERGNEIGIGSTWKSVRFQTTIVALHARKLQ